ncbi:MAG: hypothetical protein CEN87_471 [Parcubacteria group bacterium Licking1014_1]|nr:MAG: hypothetical protein CEN87_471 [Parcubacteria group bacterium Licking1014_1]
MLFFRFPQIIKSFFHRLKKSKIKAVHDSDLTGVLSSLGVLQKVQNGEAICEFCKNVVGMENLEAVFNEGGNIKFICSKPDCVSKL